MQVHPGEHWLDEVHCGFGVTHIPLMHVAGEVQSVSLAQPSPGFVQTPAMQVSGEWQSLLDVHAPFGATQAFATHCQLAGQSALTVQVPGTQAPVMQVEPEAQLLFWVQTAVPLGMHASPPSTAVQVVLDGHDEEEPAEHVPKQ